MVKEKMLGPKSCRGLSSEETSESIYQKLSPADKSKADRTILSLNDFVQQKENLRTFTIQEDSSQLRKYYHRIIRECYPHLTKNTEEKNSIKLLNLSTESDFESYLASELANKQKSVDELVGFNQIFAQIAQKNIALIGHNCYLDLLFLYDNFIGGFSTAADSDARTHQEQYWQWKRELTELFPSVYDTKFICQKYFSERFDFQSTLQQIKDKLLAARAAPSQKQLSRRINLNLPSEIREGWDLESNGNQSLPLHNAGFDSYLTVWSFLQMSAELPLEKLNAAKNIINVMSAHFNIKLDQDTD